MNHNPPENLLSYTLTINAFANIAVTHMGTGTLVSAARHKVPVPHVLREL